MSTNIAIFLSFASVATSLTVSPDNSCGAANGFTCPSTLPFCSSSGWCGTSQAYGGQGCQALYSFVGKCAAPSLESPDNSCGGIKGYKCPSLLPFCSASGWCGSTAAYGGLGCQSKFSFNALCAPVSLESPDNSCGPLHNNYTCPTDLPYCSSSGWCGTTLAYGGSGCQALFSFNKQCLDISGKVVPFQTQSTLPLSTNGRCGASFGSQCPTGQCCSQSGWCGTGIENCGMTFFACQVGYGQCSSPATDNPVPPPGSYPAINTSLTGTLHLSCQSPGQFVLGYDDGLFKFDAGLLQTLAQKNVKATFFVNGYNWADLTLPPYNSVLKQLYDAGHQIASHTFDHLDLKTLSLDALYATMRRNDVAINKVIGVAPRYVRAPFGSVTPKILQALESWGYIVVWQNINNWDTNHAGPSIPEDQQLLMSLGNVTSTLNNSNPVKNSFISLAHENLAVTAQNYTPQLIDLVKGRGYKFVNIGECLKGSASSSTWYRPLPTS